MTRGRRQGLPDTATADYRHTQEKRTNIPPAKIAGEGRAPKIEKARYHYSPHLPPVLRFDPSGAADRLPEPIADGADRRGRPAAAQARGAEAAGRGATQPRAVARVGRQAGAA